MKIVFLGDSITDMGRDEQSEVGGVYSYGSGYVFFVAGELLLEDPNGYEILNRGCGGDRIYNLYARLKKDVWNEQPDVVSIMIGVNDVESPFNPTGTDMVRWEKIYRMLIEETKEKLPNVQFILCEPYAVYVDETRSRAHKWRIESIQRYRELLQKFAKEYGCKTVWVQDKLTAAAEKNGAVHYVYDGTHPNIAGSKLMAEEWLKVFKQIKN
ncbi:MAG: SGNH/GDSL hydrolase family protein [Clostridia bacterium]|nr:SGNH/GDSL hydrolase family protein [Clostridia bacterium]